MASAERKRFADHTEQEIVEKRAIVIPKNTQKANDQASKMLTEYLHEKGQEEDLHNFRTERLAEVLSRFYLDARKDVWKRYKVSTIEHFRHSLNRYLKSPPHMKVLDIVKDRKFYEANECFKTAAAELKSLGMGATAHFPVITEDDRKKLYPSLHMSPNTPSGLANKCQFGIRLYFCRRGCENLYTMNKNTFTIHQNPATGLRHVVKTQDELTKNHRPNDEACFSGFMPEIPSSDSCPVKSFVRYTQGINPNYDRVFDI